MRYLMLATRLTLASLLLSLSGCGTRTILVQPGETLALAKPVDAVVFAPDKVGTLVESPATLPAGTLVKVPASAVQLPAVK